MIFLCKQLLEGKDGNRSETEKGIVARRVVLKWGKLTVAFGIDHEIAHVTKWQF